VAALALVALCGHPTTSTAQASSPIVNEIIIQYGAGAPPQRWNGEPWGAQCVPKSERQLLERGRRLGAGMRVIELVRPISFARAARIATALGSCPYVSWAEPNRPLTRAS
jgi:hypothetical protein